MGSNRRKNVRWYSGLLLGENLKAKSEEIKFSFGKKKEEPDVFLICLAANGKDLFDILSAYDLFQRGAANWQWDIIGMARTKDEAVELSTEFLKEVFRQTGGFDVRAFVEGQMQAF